MFSNSQELQDRVLQLIQNERGGRGLDAGVIGSACDSAVAIVSRVLPREISTTLDGDGSASTFALSSLSAWASGLSRIVLVEYPDGEQEPTILDESEYQLWPGRGAATHLKFLSTTPASGTDNIRVVYTGVHSVTTSESTFADHEEPGVEHVAAAEACEIYAARYGHTTDAGIDADAINYSDKARSWMDMAASHRKTASKILGVDLVDAAPVAAAARSGWADLDPRPQPFQSLIYRSRKSR